MEFLKNKTIMDNSEKLKANLIRHTYSERYLPHEVSSFIHRNIFYKTWYWGLIASFSYTWLFLNTIFVDSIIAKACYFILTIMSHYLLKGIDDFAFYYQSIPDKRDPKAIVKHIHQLIDWVYTDTPNDEYLFSPYLSSKNQYISSTGIPYIKLQLKELDHNESIKSYNHFILKSHSDILWTDYSKIEVSSTTLKEKDWDEFAKFINEDAKTDLIPSDLLESETFKKHKRHNESLISINTEWIKYGATSTGTFTQMNGSVKEISYMRSPSPEARSRKNYFYKDSHYKMFLKECKNDISIVFILPNKGKSLNVFEQNVYPHQYIDKLWKNQPVRYKIPMFSVDKKVDISDIFDIGYQQNQTIQFKMNNYGFGVEEEKEVYEYALNAMHLPTPYDFKATRPFRYQILYKKEIVLVDGIYNGE